MYLEVLNNLPNLSSFFVVCFHPYVVDMSGIQEFALNAALARTDRGLPMEIVVFRSGFEEPIISYSF